jgi:transcriptional regulator with XRE-family HTH domain
VDDPLLTEDARGLVADLTVRRQSVATAESLTAGLLAATLAGVAGAVESRRAGTKGCATGVYQMNCWPGGKRSAMISKPSLLREVIGAVLRRARTTQRRTLREVSDAARVSLGYLSEVERGRKEASSELLSAICDALDVPLSQLLVDAGEQLAREDHAQDLTQVFTQNFKAVPAGAANIDASTKVVIPPVASMAVA